jgi:hypothetical protein
MKPIFILSQPRSGSTLLQKILTHHDQIHSTSECWFMLSLQSVWNCDGCLSFYGSRTASSAFVNMFSKEELSRESFLKAARLFAEQVYSDACEGESAVYFIDKTPRYFWIADDLIDIFPDAKFIFLYRNPVSVLSSMMNEWGEGGFKYMQAYIDDLVHAPSMLLSANKRISSNSLTFKYETLINNPDRVLKELSIFLDLEVNSELLEGISQTKFSGSLGDRTGQAKYVDKLSNASINSWKNCVNSKLRKFIFMRVVKNIGLQTVSAMDYNYKEIIQEIDEIKHKFNALQTFKDIFIIMVCIVKYLITASVYREKSIFLRKNKFPLKLQ